MKNKMIEVKDLVKNYGDLEAVKGINFYVNEGSMFALLGPNGAGKSTTIKIITTLLQKTSGDVLINGHYLDQEDDFIRNDLGVIFQESLLDDELTVYENLYLKASFYYKERRKIIERINEVATIIDIKEILKRKYGMLSGGQRRRVDIARALLSNPKILILDEPTTGLDPKSRVQVWETIKYLQLNLNMTIFLTTHYMEEAAKADYIIIIDHGLIITEGTPNELKEKYAKDSLRLNVNKDKKEMVESYLKQCNYNYTYKTKTFHVELDNTFDAIPILNDLKDNLTSFEVIHGTIDDVFVNVISNLEEIGGYL